MAPPCCTCTSALVPRHRAGGLGGRTEAAAHILMGRTRIALLVGCGVRVRRLEGHHRKLSPSQGAVREGWAHDCLGSVTRASRSLSANGGCMRPALGSVTASLPLRALSPPTVPEWQPMVNVTPEEG